MTDTAWYHYSNHNEFYHRFIHWTTQLTGNRQNHTVTNSCIPAVASLLRSQPNLASLSPSTCSQSSSRRWRVLLLGPAVNPLPGGELRLLAPSKVLIRLHERILRSLPACWRPDPAGDPGGPTGPTGWTWAPEPGYFYIITGKYPGELCWSAHCEILRLLLAKFYIIIIRKFAQSRKYLKEVTFCFGVSSSRRSHVMINQKENKEPSVQYIDCHIENDTSVHSCGIADGKDSEANIYVFQRWIYLNSHLFSCKLAYTLHIECAWQSHTLNLVL